MSEVTIAQLASDVGIPVQRLLSQLEEAGISKSHDTDIITEEEKRALLNFLRRNNEDGVSRQVGSDKITLNKKTISELRQPSNTTRGLVRGGRNTAKTVSVEVRQKQILDKTITSTSHNKPKKSKFEKEQKTNHGVITEKQVQRKIIEDDQEKPYTRLVKSIPPKKKKEEIEQKVKHLRKDKEEKIHSKSVLEKRHQQEIQQYPVDKKSVKKKVNENGNQTEKMNKRREKSIKKKDPSELHTTNNKSIKQKKKEQYNEILSQESKQFPEIKHKFQKPTKPVIHNVEIPNTISVSDLAQRMSVKATEVIRNLMKIGFIATINEILDQDIAALIVDEMGHNAIFQVTSDEEMKILKGFPVVNNTAELRAPVVTIMGHVDHGKTSLLDYIRQSKITNNEAGGITQHIGAYHVDTGYGSITFLDTPGHAAFSTMRARGAKITDIIIIVVAADDGIMPQTIEAIQHAKAAQVPIIVAINKIDKPEAQPDRIMQQLITQEIVPEEWGGDNQCIEVSAYTGKGINDLLESIILQSELLELKVASRGPAKGTIIESSLDRGRGAIATILVQRGRLNKGDPIVCGSEFGRVRAMFNENGQDLQSAGPSIPVAVLGLSGAPQAGDDVVVVPDDSCARELAEIRRKKQRDHCFAEQKTTKLKELFSNMEENKSLTLNIVVKADVQGSVEALKESLEQISTEEVKVKVIASGVGGINESDTNLAVTSDAIIIGFNVRADAAARRILEERGLELRHYSVIYEVIDDIKQAMIGLLAPDTREEIIGLAEVRNVFHSSKIGTIAGCMVLDGTIKRSNPIRVLRDDIVIFEGDLDSLRRFKNDVHEVKASMECGIRIKNYNDIKSGDKIEVFKRIKKVTRK